MVVNKKFFSALRNVDLVLIAAAVVLTAAVGFVCLNTPVRTAVEEFIFDLKMDEMNTDKDSQINADFLYDFIAAKLGLDRVESEEIVYQAEAVEQSDTEAEPFFYAANDYLLEVDLDAKAVMAEAEPAEGEVSAGDKPIVARDYSKQSKNNIKLWLNNQTNLNVDLNDFIKRTYPVQNIKLDEPVVLILCTHATESYSPEGATGYSPAFSGARTDDPEENMIAVGKVLCDTLNANGVPAVQSLTMHDAVSYQNSYARSLETMYEYIAKYPTIKYIFDVHRDSIIDADGVKYKPTVSVDGENTAQVMFVVGSNAGGGDHAGWTDNLTFATYLQNSLNKYYPSLTRPINLREVRFNQHTAPAAVIMEVGSCGNYLSEAKRSVRLVGTVLAELIKAHAE